MLENVNLELYDKDYLIIVGPNGGGKTTLVKLILGILKPFEGEIKIFGKPPKEALDLIGYVPQKMNAKIDFPLKVIDIVLLGLKQKTGRFFHSSKDLSKAEGALEKVEMLDMKNRKLSELSGGQIQRVYLARGIVADPLLLILDEPTSNIDPYGTFCFFSLLEEINKTKPIIMVTHNLNLLASKINKIACVNKYLLFNDKPVLTRQMMEVMYGVHDEHLCSIGSYVSEEIKHLKEHEHRMTSL